jgi:hypothetical protein
MHLGSDDSGPVVLKIFPKQLYVHVKRWSPIVARSSLLSERWFTCISISVVAMLSYFHWWPILFCLFLIISLLKGLLVYIVIRTIWDFFSTTWRRHQITDKGSKIYAYARHLWPLNREKYVISCHTWGDTGPVFVVLYKWLFHIVD